MSTRNTRLTAIHSLFRYAALRHPEHAESIQRVLAIPAKRHEQELVCFLPPASASQGSQRAATPVDSHLVDGRSATDRDVLACH